MGELRNIALQRMQDAEDYNKLVQTEKELLEQANEDAYFEREAIREAAFTKRNAFSTYKNNVKKLFVTEAMKKLYLGCIKNPTNHEISVCEAFLGDFISSRGVDQLLENFRNSNTPFLETMGEMIDKKYDEVVTKVDPDDPNTFVVDREHVNDFLKEIDDQEDVEDVTNIIRLRVSNAEEDFVNRNERDKQNMKDVLDATAQRVQDAKPDLDNDYMDDDSDDSEGVSDSEIIKQESMIDAKRKIYEINSAPRTIFDRMVRNTSEAVIKDSNLRDEFIIEGGRLNMDKVVDSVRCMYTLLEMVSTLKIENVDAQYIEDTIKSI